MKTQLNEDALEIESVVNAALRNAGGVDLARAAENGGGTGEVPRILERLGLWDLNAHESAESAEAAAAVCRAAGRVALPYPVAERMAALPEEGFDAIAVATGGRNRTRVNLFDGTKDLRWVVSDGRTSIARVVEGGGPLRTQLGALVSDVELAEESAEVDQRVAWMALTLPCWTLLGMMESALEMTRIHLLDRHQFGKPLASFQALQFRLADTATAFQGFEELAKYTLWSVSTNQPGAAVDALACRLAALEAADTVFRTGHQMHGAMGFCSEVDLSWLSRHSQPLRRLPWGRSQTHARLMDAMADVPFTSLYGNGLMGAAASSAS